jgi:hypothetical protein
MLLAFSGFLPSAQFRKFLVDDGLHAIRTQFRDIFDHMLDLEALLGNDRRLEAAERKIESRLTGR